MKSEPRTQQEILTQLRLDPSLAPSSRTVRTVVSVLLLLVLGALVLSSLRSKQTDFNEVTIHYMTAPNKYALLLPKLPDSQAAIEKYDKESAIRNIGVIAVATTVSREALRLLIEVVKSRESKDAAAWVISVEALENMPPGIFAYTDAFSVVVTNWGRSEFVFPAKSKDFAKKRALRNPMGAKIVFRAPFITDKSTGEVLFANPTKQDTAVDLKRGPAISIDLVCLPIMALPDVQNLGCYKESPVGA